VQASPTANVTRSATPASAAWARAWVDPEDLGAWVGAGERDRRRAEAAAEVQHAGRRCGAQPPVDVSHRGQPGAGELVEEHRPVGRGDAAPHLRTVGGIGDAVAGAVGLQQLRQHPGDAREHDRERRGVVGAVGVQEHLGVPGGQPVAALLGGAPGVVAGQVAGGRLLL
jgi:hypothetical protein